MLDKTYEGIGISFKVRGEIYSVLEYFREYGVLIWKNNKC